MRTSLTVTLLLLGSAPLVAQEKSPAPKPSRPPLERVVLRNAVDSVSYAVGLNLGTQAARDSVFLNADALAAGLRDALEPTGALLTEEQINQVMMAFQRKIMERKATLED